MKKKKVLVLSIIGILIIGTAGLLLKGGLGSSEAEKYYKENGRIVSKTKADKSQNIGTESDVIEDLESRGFTQYPITYGTTVEGDILNETIASDASAEKHPEYVTYYISSSSQTWTISVTDGSITAFPVEYNQKQKGQETIVSESDTVKAYDIETNTVFELIPNNNHVRIVQLDRITPETLDDLTNEVLDEK